MFGHSDMMEGANCLAANFAHGPWTSAFTTGTHTHVNARHQKKSIRAYCCLNNVKNDTKEKRRVYNKRLKSRIASCMLAPTTLSTWH